MSLSPRTPSWMLKINRVIWAVAAFLLVGYVPTLYSTALFPNSSRPNPTISIALAACAIIPLGSRARSIWRALGRGLALGGVAGMAVAMALVQMPPLSESYQKNVLAPQYLMIFTTSTAALCALVSALFFFVAKRRQQRIEDQWRR